MELRVEHVTKTYGAFTALRDVSLTIADGSLTALLGPSGSGKSTLLRVLAGLDHADSGRVFFDNVDVTTLGANERGIGFVFQHYALFRHMTIVDNIAFGLKVRGTEKAKAKRRAEELLHLVGLGGLGHRYPAELSGGQRQRVALARALAPEPKVLLLDEPFGAIDAKVREDLRIWLRKLHDEIHVTSVFVTHDQDEAFSISDHVGIIHAGNLEQVGTPERILDEPATEFVARFVGEVNVFNANVSNGMASVGALRVEADLPTGQTGAVHLVIRSYDLKFWREDPGHATVTRVVTLGDRVRVHAEADGAGPVVAQFPRRSTLLKGVEPGVRIHIEITKARCYPAKTSNLPPPRSAVMQG